MKKGIKEYLNTITGQNLTLIDHFSLHIFFVLELAQKWRDYVNLLEC
jgi:hypothetical protein